MRFANRGGRAFVLKGSSAGWDLEKQSSGRFSWDPMQMWAQHEEIAAWVAGLDESTAEPVAPEELDAPVPVPPSIIAIGLNYAEHARETGFEPPTELPPVFAKFPSSVTGAHDVVRLPEGGTVDWEVEVVAVVGTQMHDVDEAHVLGHLAGLTVGQDLSERTRQFSGPAPQFGLAKSCPGFSPIGPWVVSLDELDPEDLHLGCSIDGETVQSGTTANLIFSISRSLSELSRVLVLRPGDLVFTGTPDGVGMGLQPPRYLRSGEVLETWVEGIGRMRHTMV